MVAVEHIQRARELEWVERAHFHARVREGAPEATRSLAHRTEPVVHEIHAYAGARPFRQRRRELAADPVIADEVVLEVDLFARGVNCLEPRRIVRRRVLQQPHAIAIDERRARRARERAIEQRILGSLAHRYGNHLHAAGRVYTEKKTVLFS